MLSSLPILIGYVLLSRLSLQYLPRRAGEFFFSALNITALYLLFYSTESATLWSPFVLCGAYVMCTLLHYTLVWWSTKQSGRIYQLAFFYPLLVLVGVRYIPPFLTQSEFTTQITAILGSIFVGLSYMSFRLSYLALEVRNGTLPLPSIWNYLSFSFFIPTMLVGPINRASVYTQSLSERNFLAFPAWICLQRILVGAAKYYYLGNLLNQLTFESLLDGDFPKSDPYVAMCCYYLYLYCNFSGFCDMAIGTAGLLGIRVEENFDRPFAARNVKDFWNRWHITLSTYLRDVLFTPLSKTLAKRLVSRFGPGATNHVIAFCICCVFIVVGIWHGVGWNFLLFGLLHAIGVIANHYYSIFLKRTLSKENFKRYNESSVIKYISICFTFIFVSFSFVTFANSIGQVYGLLKSL